MSKTYQAVIKDLQESIITYSAPEDFDGTVSLSVVNGKVHIKFNSDFVDKYEERLLQEG